MSRLGNGLKNSLRSHSAEGPAIGRRLPVSGMLLVRQ